MTAYAHKNRVVPGGFSFAPKAPEPVADQINAAIDAALEAENAAQKPRGYLGGSRLGLECHRRLGFEYAQSRAAVAAVREGRPPESAHFPGRIIRRFRLGHLHEDETARWLRLAGFELHTHTPDGGQYGFGVAPDPMTGEMRIAGHIDGCLTAGPVALPYPTLWEHKIMASKHWRNCAENGVRTSHAVYWFQMQVYMAYLDLGAAVFTALNTDTSELLHEIVPFVPDDAQWASDRGVAVLEADSPIELPRIAREASDYRCKMCPFADPCWQKPAPPAELAKPAWLMGESA